MRTVKEKQLPGTFEALDLKRRTQRELFHEITKNAIQDALKTQKDRQNLVDAQQREGYSTVLLVLSYHQCYGEKLNLPFRLVVYSRLQFAL